MQMRHVGLMACLLATGCVSSQQYRLKEQEASALQAQKTQLEQQAKDLQDKLNQLSQEKTKLDENLKTTEQEKEAKEAELDKIKGTYDQLVSNLKKEIDAGQIQVTQLKDKLTVNMVDKILFDSGQSQIKPKGLEVLSKIGAVLKNVADKDIRVEGHTDNVPLSRKLQARYPSNWELSATRATNVVRYLQDHAGVDPSRLIAAGYSQYHPIAANDSAEGRLENRRIEIVLVPREAVTPANTSASTSTPQAPPAESTGSSSESSDQNAPVSPDTSAPGTNPPSEQSTTAPSNNQP